MRRFLYRLFIAWTLCWHAILVMLFGAKELKRLYDCLGCVCEGEDD